MTIRKYIILAFALVAFMVSSSASAAMACCWDMQGQGQAESSDMEDMPCHTDDKTDSSDETALDCCADMALCKAPLVFGSQSDDLTFTSADIAQQPFTAGLIFIESTGPPTPPPKSFL